MWFCIGVKYSRFATHNNVGKQIISILSSAFQKRSSSAISLLFVQVDKIFRHPPYTHVVISEHFCDNRLDSGACNMQKFTSQSTNLQSPHFFVGLNTGLVTSSFLIHICGAFFQISTLLSNLTFTHYCMPIHWAQLPKTLTTWKFLSTQQAFQNWREKRLSWTLRYAFADRPTPTESKQQLHWLRKQPLDGSACVKYQPTSNY